MEVSLDKRGVVTHIECGICGEMMDIKDSDIYVSHTSYGRITLTDLICPDCYEYLDKEDEGEEED